jgi:hypothetical protein
MLIPFMTTIDDEKILAVLSASLGLLLVISEVLAWSKCRWNSISEFLLMRNISCIKPRDIESQ